MAESVSRCVERSREHFSTTLKLFKNSPSRKLHYVTATHVMHDVREFDNTWGLLRRRFSIEKPPLGSRCFCPFSKKVRRGIADRIQCSIIAKYARSSSSTPGIVRLVARLNHSAAAPAAIGRYFPRYSLLQTRPQLLGYSRCTIGQ